MNYLGDFTLTKRVYIPFNTFDADGASITVTDLTANDIYIHKNGGTTQRASASGVTVSIDYDGITGNHLVTIDLSDDSDPGFYATGYDYLVRLEGITVDTKTLNCWIGCFSIVNRYARGTDDAFLAVNAPTNFSDLAITASTGLVDINDKTDFEISGTKTTLDDLNDFDNLNDQVTVSVNNDKTGYSISGTKTTLDALNDIAVNNILAGIVEGTVTLQQALRLMIAEAAGKTSGSGTATAKFRDTTDTKDRITATLDGNGNRLTVVLDLS